MLSIRLRRIGKKKRASFRLIVVERRKDPQGDFLEDLGFMNPHTHPRTISFAHDRITHWLSKGAQPSDTVRNMLIDAKLMTGAKVHVGRAPSKQESQPQGEVKTEAQPPQ